MMMMMMMMITTEMAMVILGIDDDAELMMLLLVKAMHALSLCVKMTDEVAGWHRIQNQKMMNSCYTKE